MIVHTSTMPAGVDVCTSMAHGGTMSPLALVDTMARETLPLASVIVVWPSLNVNDHIVKEADARLPESVTGVVNDACTWHSDGQV